MGLDEWSMDAASVAKQKFALSRLHAVECRALLERAIDSDTAAEVRGQAKDFYETKFGAEEQRQPG